MRISKRQLRRIIKEEKRKLLNETVTDMVDFESATLESIEKISWEFGNAMFVVFDEEPEAFAGRTTQEQWEQQVTSAQDELVVLLTEAINKAVEQVEMNLHDGQYHRG